MSEDQLKAFLATLQGDTLLQEKLEKATNLEATLALIKEAGFEVSKDDWLSYEANLSSELSDDSLENVQGGVNDRAAVRKVMRNSRKAENTLCSVSEI